MQAIDRNVDVVAAPGGVELAGNLFVFTIGLDLPLEQEEKIFVRAVVFCRTDRVEVEFTERREQHFQFSFRDDLLLGQHDRVCMIDVDQCFEKVVLGILKTIGQHIFGIAWRRKFLYFN